MTIRPIREEDNASVASLIREVLTEFGANRPGFAWQDPELDRMAQAYDKEDRVYKVVERNGKVIGVGGIGPFRCKEHAACCELQKMYFFPQYRGLGLGRQLIENLMEDAKALGYSHCYLESLSSMHQAIGLYLKQGFEDLSKPLGDSGHNACDRWLLKAF